MSLKQLNKLRKDYIAGKINISDLQTKTGIPQSTIYGNLHYIQRKPTAEFVEKIYNAAYGPEESVSLENKPRHQQSPQKPVSQS